MRIRILVVSIVSFLLAAPAMAGNWVDNVNIFVRPQGAGVMLSGLGNNVYVKVLNNDRS